MAEDQKETFMDKSRGYADQYEKALRENAEAFKEIAIECISKGIKTVEEVKNDAKQFGINIKTETLNLMKKAEEFTKGKVDVAKAKATEVKGKVVDTAKEAKQAVVDKAGEIRDGVVTGAAMATGAVIATGRLGKNAVITGAKTVQEKYSAKKEEVQKGLRAAKAWLEAKRESVKGKVTEVKGKVVETARGAKQVVVDKAGEIRDGIGDAAETAAIYGMMAGDKVVDTARKVKHGAKDAVETAAIYGMMAGDKVKDAAETAAIYGMMAGDKVVDTAKKARDGVITGAAMATGAVIATGRLGKNVVITGAKTVQESYKAAKGTAAKGVEIVGKWFNARGKDILKARDAVYTRAGQIKDDVTGKVTEVKGKVVETARGAKQVVVDKAGEIRDGIGDAAETAAIYGMMAGDKVVDTARKVKHGAKDAVETAAIYGMMAGDKVKDAAETAAIYGMMAGDKVVDTAKKARDGVITGAAMATGAVIATGRLGKNVVITGAKTVQESYKAAKGTAAKGVEIVGKWFNARGKDILKARDAVYTRAGQIKDDVTGKVTEVKGKVVDRARDVKDGVVSTARDTKQAVIDRAGQIRDGVVDGAARVTGAAMATKNIVGDQLQKASSRVQTRANTSIVNFAQSGRSFFNKLFDRLETSAVSREEINQSKQQEREAAKNRQLKGQDGQEK